MTGSPAASDLCSQRELNCEETVKSFQERWSDLFAAHLSVSGIASSASCMRSRTPSGLQQQPAGPQPVTTSVCSSPPESLLQPRTPLQAESPHSQRDEPWLDSPIEPIKDIFFSVHASHQGKTEPQACLRIFLYQLMASELHKLR